MGAFLTFIVILFLFFWLTARFGPLLLAWWIKRKVSKFAEESRGYSAGDEKFKEGETIINNGSRPQSKVVDKNVGEYIDYEETKEETKDEAK